MDYEESLYQGGYRAVFGVDEAGRGAWAGPVVSAAVCLPEPTPALFETLTGVRDSKQMTRRQRESFEAVIHQHALTWGVGKASSDEIDAHGIVPATRLAMTRAIDSATERLNPDYLLIDGRKWHDAPYTIPLECLTKGDQRSLSIAAASVLAKVHRDRIMIELDEEFAVWNFGKHKGYGTSEHRAHLNRYGLSSIHRRCFRPMKEL